MALIVAKFGGTSLCEGRMFERVIDIIRAEPARRVIVVSAPGKRDMGDEKVTDLLLEFERTRSGAPWARVARRFREIARTLGANVDEQLERIRALILAGAGRMYAASRGEYLSAKLLAGALDFSFLDAADCVRFTRGGALALEDTLDLLAARASVSRGTVIPGFYGATRTGSVTTFPRGGSDITGALAARALMSDVYENWTDVDGVYTRDPARGEGARLISRLSYKAMLAICASGANVLHPDSLAPVMQAGIPIIVRSTYNPESPGTRIQRD